MKNKKQTKVPEMLNKQTRHAIRTRALIARSFVNLMERNSFEDIGIVDICNEALITRATFYKYYEDKNHLVCCMLRDHCEEMFKQAGLGDETKSPKEVYDNILRMIADFVVEDREKIRGFLEIVCSDRLRSIIMQKMTGLVEELLTTLNDDVIKLIPVEIAASLIVGGFAQILRYVFENEKTYTADEVVKYFNSLYDNFHGKEN